MATKVRGGPPTKEKRGTSPSQPGQQKGPTTQRGKSPITPKVNTTSCPSPTSAAAKRSTSTSPSGRNVPNYLKPTRTTGPESSTNPVKKQPSNDTTLKPVMSRRKSLDKPLPPSSAIPKTRVSAIAKDMRSPLPASPSSARANTSSSKANVGGRIGKARSFNADKESRVVNLVKKVENEASVTKGLSTKDTINEVADDNENLAHINHNNAINDDTPHFEAIGEKVEEFDLLSEDHDDNIEREVIVMEDNKTVDPEIEEAKIDEPSVTPKDETENQHFDHPIVDETPNNNEEQEPHIATCTEEISIPDQDIENASEEKEVEVEEKEHEEEKTEVEVEVEAKADVEEVIEGKQEETEETKESETVKEEDNIKEDDIKEVKKVEENKKIVNNENGGGGMKRVVQVVQGKKEMSVVSNDVIEETATKLREQRVNRVKALAGAFETVISNQ